MKSIAIVFILLVLSLFSCDSNSLDIKAIEGNWAFKSIIREHGEFNWDSIKLLRKSSRFNLMRFEPTGAFTGDYDGTFLNDKFSFDAQKNILTVGKKGLINIFKLSNDTLVLKYVDAKGANIYGSHLFLYLKDKNKYDEQSIFHPTMNTWRTQSASPLAEADLKAKMVNMVKYLDKRFEVAIMKGQEEPDLGKLCTPIEITYEGIQMLDKESLCKEWYALFSSNDDVNKAYDYLNNAFKKTEFSSTKTAYPIQNKELMLAALLENLK
jgi:hypothetical protein